MERIEARFLHAATNEALIPSRDEIVARSEKFDAAIAFVTRKGASDFHEIIRQLQGNARLVASVRPPTDIWALVDVVREFPGCIRIHTMQVSAEIGQVVESGGMMHSKTALSTRCGGDTVDVLTGSHNWTLAGLHGINAEASTHCVASKSSQFVSDAQEHFDRLWREAIPLTPENAGGFRQGKSTRLDDLEKDTVTVIHAEAEDEEYLQEDDRIVCINLPKKHADLFDVFPRPPGKVHLWTYPPRTLLKPLREQGRPAAEPFLFKGICPTLELKGALEKRVVNANIVDPEDPRLRHDEKIPQAESGGRQTVVEVSRSGDEGLFVYFEKGRERPGYIYKSEKRILENREIFESFSVSDIRNELPRAKIGKAVVFENVYRRVPTGRIPMQREFYSAETIGDIFNIAPQLPKKPRTGASRFFYIAEYYKRRNRWK